MRDNEQALLPAIAMTKPTVNPEILAALEELVAVVAQLRAPEGGCPWDLAQTSESLIPYIVEEAYETVAAIQSGDRAHVAEELGDLLLQVVLQAQVAQDGGEFTLADVARGIAAKLVRRHPHVFDGLEVENVDQVRQNWEQIKAAEKGETPEQAQLLSRKLDRYNRTLPPLLASEKMSQKAAAAGFEWESVAGVWDKFAEELAEFKAALQTEDRQHQQAELGDLLFTLVNLARWYDLDPSQALQGTNQRLVQRLSLMEQFAERPLSEYAIAELDELWAAAKAQLRGQAPS